MQEACYISRKSIDTNIVCCIELETSIDMLFDKGGSGSQAGQGGSAGVGEGTNIQPVTEATGTVIEDVALLQPRLHHVLPNRGDTIHERPSGKIRDPASVVADFNTRDYGTLVAHPSPFRKFPKEFLCLVGLSRHYTLDEETYMRSSHPPKKLREDHGTPSGPSVAGKSRSAVQRILVRAVMNDEVRGEPIPTLPFVTSSNTLGLGLGLRERLDLCLLPCSLALIVLDSEYRDVPEDPPKFTTGYNSCHNTPGGLRRTRAHLGLAKLALFFSRPYSARQM
nr:hypothetical protein [Tanacetum cinerariifolium]